MLYIPVISFSVIYKTSSLKDEAFQKRFQTFIIDLRTNHPLCFHFISIFFFRRAVYACCFVIFSTMPKVQVFFIFSTVICMTLYLVLIMPYKSVLSKLLSIVNEVFLGVMIGLSFRFINPVVEPSVSKSIGNILVIMLISTIAFNWASIITYGIISFVKSKIKKKRLKQSKVNIYAITSYSSNSFKYDFY